MSTKAITTAIIGNNMDKMVMIPAPAVSVVLTTEFPNPPVVAVEIALPPVNPALMVAAVPPPAINAKDQSGNASKGVN